MAPVGAGPPTPPGSPTLGSATDSTRTSPVPCSVIAFMSWLLCRSEIAEVREVDSLAGEHGARLGRGEAGHLGLPLLAVAAIGEVIVEVAGMGHELAPARGERAQVLEHALAGPVGIGARLAHEVIRSADAILLRPG